MRLSPPPLRGYWFLGVTDCIGKPGSSSHGLCEVREASCLSVTDGRMRALPTSLAWRAVKPALGSSCPSECRGSVVVISLQVPVLAWIRRRRLDQNPKRLKNLLRRSNSLHRTRTSPSCGLLCSSNSGSELHTDFSKTVVSRHARKPLWYRSTTANSEMHLCSQTIKKKGHHSHQHVNLLRSISWQKARLQHDRKHRHAVNHEGMV